MKKIQLLPKYIKQITLFLLLTPLLTGCSSSISNYSAQAYKQTTSLKVDAMNVMDLTNESYALHKEEVKEFETKVQKVYEFEKNRPKNELSVKLWDKLIDKEGALLGGYLNKWKTKESGAPTFSKAFIRNAKKSVGKAFDIISSLESEKIKPSEVE